jgi:hypothetical protein
MKTTITATIALFLIFSACKTGKVEEPATQETFQINRGVNISHC